jgi:hypothetical protein
MTARPKFTSSFIHWQLIAATEKRDHKLDAPFSDDGYVASQALFCPYYATLEGALGSDWGVILNPESVKFGEIVFEHAWCGCPTSTVEHGEWFADHGSGAQQEDEWVVPGCRSWHTFRSGYLDSCWREKSHRGRHQGRIGSWR